MYIYIAIAVAVLVVLVIAYYFIFGGPSWADLKKRKAGETDDAWSRRIFGALRMNPKQGVEQATIDLSNLLKGKTVISEADAMEFVKTANIWYSAQLEQSGLAKNGVLVGF